MNRKRLSNSSPHKRARKFFIIGLLLSVASIFYVLGSQFLPHFSSRSPQFSPAPVVQAAGDESIEKLFSQAGCAVCHIILGIPGAEGRVGPSWCWAAQALCAFQIRPTEAAPPPRSGYVMESILNPGAYVVTGYPD